MRPRRGGVYSTNAAFRRDANDYVKEIQGKQSEKRSFIYPSVRRDNHANDSGLSYLPGNWRVLLGTDRRNGNDKTNRCIRERKFVDSYSPVHARTNAIIPKTGVLTTSRVEGIGNGRYSMYDHVRRLGPGSPGGTSYDRQTGPGCSMSPTRDRVPRIRADGIFYDGLKKGGKKRETERNINRIDIYKLLLYHRPYEVRKGEKKTRQLHIESRRKGSPSRRTIDKEIIRYLWSGTLGGVKKNQTEFTKIR